MKVEKLHYDVFVNIDGNNKGSSYNNEDIDCLSGCETNTNHSNILCGWSCNADDANNTWFNAEKQLDSDVMLYSDLLDMYFDAIGDAEEELKYLNSEEGSSISLYDLRLYLCEPNYISVNGECCLVSDIAPEDMSGGDIMSCETMDEIIDLHKAVSYNISNIAFDVEKYLTVHFN